MKESLHTVAAMKPVRRGGGGCRPSMLRRSVRESAAAAIGAQENTKPYTSKRGARRPAASQERDSDVVAVRGRWGQRLHRRALSNGGGTSGGTGFPRTLRDIAVAGV